MLCDCQKMIDISDGSWSDKDRNMSAILRKGDGYGPERQAGCERQKEIDPSAI